MDQITKTLLRTAPGSIGETAKTYATSYSKLLSRKTTNIVEFNEAFIQVIMFRVAAYERFEINDKNLLSPITNNILNPIYDFFAEMEKHIKAGLDPIEYVDNSTKFKMDLPTMILYTMMLESNNKRTGFAAADLDFMNESLKVIHQESNLACPYQSFFTETDFIQENNRKVKLFLFNTDASLAVLIRNSH